MWRPGSATILEWFGGTQNLRENTTTSPTLDINSVEEKLIEGVEVLLPKIGLNSTESQTGLGWEDPKNHLPAPQGAPSPIQTQPQQGSLGGFNPNFPTSQRQRGNADL